MGTLAIPNGGSNSYLEANSEKLNQFNLKTYSGNAISQGTLFKQLTLSELFLFFDWEAFQTLITVFCESVTDHPFYRLLARIKAGFFIFFLLRRLHLIRARVINSLWV